MVRLPPIHGPSIHTRLTRPGLRLRPLWWGRKTPTSVVPFQSDTGTQIRLCVLCVVCMLACGEIITLSQLFSFQLLAVNGSKESQMPSTSREQSNGGGPGRYGVTDEPVEFDSQAAPASSGPASRWAPPWEVVGWAGSVWSWTNRLSSWALDRD